MSKTVDQGKNEIAKLCQYFATNRQAFLAPGVKEAHIRQSLIDPLFESLGWDVRNTAMTAPQYREVIPEDSLDVEGQQKAPDYTFRVGTLSKFYAEAKRCGVNISADPAPAYQLRRYGWSAKLALSILTDFEELGVYDCTARPRPSDKASHARIQHFRFDEYSDRWRELWDVFSREAVWSGAFDQYAASKRKRGTSEVDVEFLKEIEGWRLALAGNIALRNKDLSLDDLNAAVQLTIDRVVFLRMAEDRGLEPEQQLLKLCERPDIYPRFIRDLCRRADQKYNSGLFHFQKETGVPEDPDRITPKLAVDDKVLKSILQSLYFAYGSPYHFGVLPVEILGTVYERFLGKVIRLTAGHQAKVEEKPEVRKAGGVYYTPAYIVEYIVKHTVGRQIEGRSPTQLAGGKDRPPLRVLDMACGSGSFLLGAYQCLLDYCLKWYIEHKPEICKKAVYKDPRNGQWRLTIEEKKRILTTHLFGVDIDAQAVEVTKLSLLLKVLEGETDQSLHLGLLPFSDRALPNLADNIKCGNSLIGPDYFTGKLNLDPEEMKRVNPFDWSQGFPDAMKAGGFDCIIGNPPYVRQESLSSIKDYLEQNYEAYVSAADLYTYFMEQGVRLLRDGGRFSFIVSSSFLRTTYGQMLRRVLKKHAAVMRIVDFGGLPVFENAKDTYVCIPLLAKTRQPARVEVSRLPSLQFQDMNAIVSANRFTIPHERLSAEAWALTSDEEAGVFAKVMKSGKPLGDYVGAKIFYGIKTGLNGAFVIDHTMRDRLTDEHPKSAELIKPFLGGEEIRRYLIEDDGRHLIVIPSGWTRQEMAKAGKRAEHISERAAWAWFSTEHPSIVVHLEPFEDALRKRQDQGDYWWELRPCNYYEYFDRSKIIFPDICKEPRFYLDRSGIYLANTAYCLGVDDTYLLGILNSRLFWFAISNISIPFGVRAGKYRYRLIYQYMEKAPIRVIDFSNSADKARHDRTVTLVASMQTLHKQLATAKSAAQKAIIQRQIDATDAEIDRLVYDLYGLTAEEIAIVEGER
ncbi:MAG: Eco57I restriction-modification methylase domain-containing protein [candidate division NC10 bacterium]|nr:Eco57I restriction-modification methylase domain-containing protein [candidate division NC10 bacterium]